MSLIRLNRHPSRRQLAVFGIAWFAFCALVSARLWRHGAHSSAIILAALGTVIPLVGIVVPATLRWLYVGLSYATYPIGFVISHVVLTIVYFGVVTPIGLVVGLCGYDPLERKFEREKRSYWKIRRDRPTPQSYFRQY